MRRLCVIPGDGIGREVVPVAIEVLERLLPDLQVEEAEAGWGCFERRGMSVPQTTLASLSACGAGLFGAVSSPSHRVEGYRSAILTLRQELALNLNLRPVRSRPRVSPRQGVDLMILRENSEGLYSGREHWESDGVAIAERVISRSACVRLAAGAAELARLRNARRITLVHKANVLPLTCGLFRDTCRDALAEEGWSDVLDERLVDVAALQLVACPEAFDLIVTTNLFGDILSDLASHWGGGLGMAPSLNLGDAIALAEPVHGSAPDIAGSGRANPLAAILSAGMLLRHHWRLPALAERLEAAVDVFLEEEGSVDFGIGTTREVGRGVLQRLG
ncbi:isocitrate/isopropylmalate family dehydrogenase [Pseudomonas sp. ZM23]|uniref:Isocitrate/isopropylmalate family dehydrogenase n=1 Tax=Pseudomonas triclosanedens TaxID=2961893 RepID=A0ABY6ZY03_9PSED|nr:isocitrate/isopropylmalate family dehydrogenase [Pseudomonas triclosanedens]MCP8467883.1 isocitrate/isopropylmalate family dehydrogenase [Pseudomonas triclosanedens]MCP8473855.1 isocitrate/isopropylmalate family dehydrogenase [Pseudomonas triclosanedens]MCP8479819.1 isocitrate/isopropylmalate family dehydrogenase [Pseudomonas triclosanedens]WAI48759.1 isocitrate/isopropylmalate family dehydrogenase [Pseudomonas triclosanedens]